MDRLRQWGPTLKIFCLFVVLLFAGGSARGADSLDSYNVVWRSQSKNSAESMPVGGGDIGVNVWVENNELLFYIGRSGTFDENNQTLKLGRVRVKLDPNPFTENSWFRQELKLREGCVKIQGNSPGRVSATIEVWVEVFRPVIDVDIGADKPVTMQAQYESWRTADRELANDRKKSRFGCFGLEGYPGTVVLRKDTIGFRDNLRH